MDLSTSSSAANLISTKSSCTADSSSVMFTSVPQSVSSYRHTHYPTEFGEQQPGVMETNLDEHNEMLLDYVAHSASDFNCFTNRSLFSFRLYSFFNFFVAVS